MFRSKLSVYKICLQFYRSTTSNGHLCILQYLHDAVNIQGFKLTALNKTKHLLH